MWSHLRNLGSVALTVAALLSLLPSRAAARQEGQDPLPPAIIFDSVGQISAGTWNEQVVCASDSTGLGTTENITLDARMPYPANSGGVISGTASLQATGGSSSGIARIKVHQHVDLRFDPIVGPGRYDATYWAGWQINHQIRFYVLGGEGTPYQWTVHATAGFDPSVTQPNDYGVSGWRAIFGWGRGPNTPREFTAGKTGTSDGTTITYQGRTYSLIEPVVNGGLGDFIATLENTQPQTVQRSFDLDYEIEIRALNARDRNRPGACDGSCQEGTGPCYRLGPVTLSRETGNVHLACEDPVTTRGYPLANNIHLDTQFVETDRPLVNGTFTYDMHVRREDVYGADGAPVESWVLVDGDGSRYNFGPTTGPPTPEKGVFSALRQTDVGFVLEGAGPPEHIKRAGNFTYTFSPEGRLLSLRDPEGNRQVLEYDGSGLPLRVTDVSSGKILTFVSTGGRIRRIVENASGAYTDLTYDDTRLRIVTVYNPGGASVARAYRIDYFPWGAISTIFPDYTGLANPWVNVHYSYVSSFKEGTSVPLGSLEAAFRLGTIYDWGVFPDDGLPYRVASTTPSGGTINYDFDVERNLRRVSYPAFTGAGAPTVYRFAYDGQKNLITATDGATTWRMQYAPNGLLTRLENGAGGVWTWDYSGADLRTARDALGLLAAFGYDNAALPHRATSFTDAEGAVTGFGYTGFGQVNRIAPPDGSPLGPATFDYEEEAAAPEYGWLRQVTDGSGRTVRFDTYTGLGDPASLTTAPSPGSAVTSLLSYDALHRETAFQHPDGKQYRTDYYGNNFSVATDEAGLVTSAIRCLCGHTVEVDRPNNWVLRWTIGPDLQVTGFQDARQFTTSYSYGMAGELTQVTYPDSSSTRYLYDNFGRVREEVNGRGQAKDIAYDGAGRVAGYTFPTTGLPGIGFDYYADGSVKEMRDGVGVTRYSYWPTRRIKSVEYDYSRSGLPAVQRLDYAYFPDGSLSSLTWTNGVQVVARWDYGYDGAGRLASVANSFGETTRYGYDGEGKLKNQANANGTATAYTYNDARGWPVRIAESGPGGTIADYALTYDNGANTVGNLTGVQEAGGGTASYGYDFLYRLTGEARAGANAYSRTLGYDLAGNVTQVNGATFGAYDGANKLTSLAGGRTTHDGDGNLTSVQGAGLALGRFFWDDRSKLLRQSQGLRTVSYSYDGMGRRVQSQAVVGDTAVRTSFIYNGDALLGEVQNGSPSAAYTWGAGGLVSERLLGQGRSLWYHYGPQGETRQLTDAVGAAVDTYAYTAYGLPLAATGSDPNPFRYGGKFGYYSDGGPMGTVLCGARWYSPQLMRWLSRDPIGFTGGSNLASYCGSNPVGRTDPSGTEFFFLFDDPPFIFRPGPWSGLCGKQDNYLEPDPDAVGPHSTFKRGPESNINRYQEWNSNPRNPTGFDAGRRFDGSGASHYNKDTGNDVPTPHVHDPSTPGGVRPAFYWEYPGVV